MQVIKNVKECDPGFHNNIGKLLIDFQDALHPLER